mmetsp:Transcript_56654/g.155762  ORF Transcript_56654/g.155762 Transcript_56654/m.155762 type:complete len:330 (+) Transcript_56654:888-1877(+)
MFRQRGEVRFKLRRRHIGKVARPQLPPPRRAARRLRFPVLREFEHRRESPIHQKLLRLEQVNERGVTASAATEGVWLGAILPILPILHIVLRLARRLGVVRLGVLREPLHHLEAHERAHAHRAVVGARDGVADARIDSPHRERRGDIDVGQRLGRLAQQGEQLVPFAEQRRHLVHHAARGTHDAVLDHLGEKAELTPLDRAVAADSRRHLLVVGGEQGHHRRHLDARRRRDAFALGHVRAEEHRQPVAAKVYALLPREHQQAARDVRGPGGRRVGGEKLPRLLVLDRPAVRPAAQQLRERHLEGRPAVVVVGAHRDDAQLVRPLRCGLA